MASPSPLDHAEHRLTVIASLSVDNTWSQILRNKVPEVTILFWVAKILSTTTGETAGNFLTRSLGLGLSASTAIMSLLLATVLIWQFTTRRYVPGVYWLTVILVSAVGTLLCEDLVDSFGGSLWIATAVFSAALALALFCWYRSEHTLSVHTVVTRRREAFYWFAILCTFSLGTAVGGLFSQKLSLGHPAAVLVLGGVVVLITVAFLGLRVNAVSAFWAAYVMTRPLGGSIGDLLAANPRDGGLGLGTSGTSLLFLALLVTVVGLFAVRARTRVK
ncbi:MAG: hypothetical protein ABIR34_11255 [Marmoricola sp.]